MPAPPRVALTTDGAPSREPRRPLPSRPPIAETYSARQSVEWPAGPATLRGAVAPAVSPARSRCRCRRRSARPACASPAPAWLRRPSPRSRRSRVPEPSASRPSIERWSASSRSGAAPEQSERAPARQPASAAAGWAEARPASAASRPAAVPGREAGAPRRAAAGRRWSSRSSSPDRSPLERAGHRRREAASLRSCHSPEAGSEGPCRWASRRARGRMLQAMFHHLRHELSPPCIRNGDGPCLTSASPGLRLRGRPPRDRHGNPQGRRFRRDRAELDRPSGADAKSPTRGPSEHHGARRSARYFSEIG